MLRIGRSGEQSTGRRVVSIFTLLTVAIYGGYFGASQGILLLMVLSLVGVSHMGQANGLKNVFAVLLKGAAVAYFVSSKEIVWDAAILMGVGSAIGGYASAAVGSRVEERVLRWIAVVIGIDVAIAMLLWLR